MPAPEEKPTREFLVNHLNDSDSEWWPFVFLRPEPHEKISNARCLLFAVLHGLPATLMSLIGGALLGEAVHGAPAFSFALCVCAASFLFFHVAVASSWNRRAARLLVLRQRTLDWQARSRDGHRSTPSE